MIPLHLIGLRCQGKSNVKVVGWTYGPSWPVPCVRFAKPFGGPVPKVHVHNHAASHGLAQGYFRIFFAPQVHCVPPFFFTSKMYNRRCISFPPSVVRNAPAVQRRCESRCIGTKYACKTIVAIRDQLVQHSLFIQIYHLLKRSRKLHM